MFRWNILAPAAWRELVCGAEVLEEDGSGVKVLRLPDQTIVKLFRRKRLLSSALFYPYARRFADNALLLAERGIPCPTVLTLARVPSIVRDVVRYQPLPGNTLREELARPTNVPENARATLTAFGVFVAHLHEKGIYFRSLHLGNVVHTAEGMFGLIDFADLSCRSRPLGVSLRRRNFRHLFRLPKDRALLLSDDGAAFSAGYISASQNFVPRIPIR
ncbi:MAG: toluene tolerance protein [Zoogloeaceae bacterium]|jgi:tRNA A-37 threonylcarbamoyl transferase component Bud32|nr:toluene tolerance protein [Zoogloeaceae bacterium]